MKIDTYSIKARYAPALVSIVIPIATFNHFFVSEEISQYLSGMAGIRVFSNLTISAICLYYFSEIGRVIGKDVFEKAYFEEEARMPTTNFLMFSDATYSPQHKVRIREKVLADFGISLPSLEDESKSDDEARKRIVETMALIRKRLHGNAFLFQHNVEYGAMRNLIGGALIGVIISVAGIYFFHEIYVRDVAVSIFAVLIAIYAILLVFSKPIIKFYGRSYAKILFREYLA
jgi:hypothetical protein